jgi:diaminopimelate epimerase
MIGFKEVHPMKFTKMQGCGNDYIYVDCTKTLIENIPETARKVSDRHFGIGSDGLILIRPSEKADFMMDIYNNDGSRAKMCGNGIRCVAKFVYDKGLTKKRKLKIETLAGIKELDLTIENGEVSYVTVNMGSPIMKAREIPVITDREEMIAEPIEIAGNTYEITCLSMGNPHGVVFVEDTDTIPMETLGPLFENHKIFPDRVNTEFVQVVDRNRIKMRVWERGSGETLACGTGACASVMACILNGLTDHQVTVSLLGGDLEITYDEEANLVYMKGPAVKVFDGEINLG